MVGEQRNGERDDTNQTRADPEPVCHEFHVGILHLRQAHGLKFPSSIESPLVEIGVISASAEAAGVMVAVRPHASTSPAIHTQEMTMHWDGARLGETEPAVLILVGMGPVKTTQVDENGRPKAPPPAR